MYFSGSCNSPVISLQVLGYIALFGNTICMVRSSLKICVMVCIGCPFVFLLLSPPSQCRPFTCCCRRDLCSTVLVVSLPPLLPHPSLSSSPNLFLSLPHSPTSLPFLPPSLKASGSSTLWQSLPTAISLVHYSWGCPPSTLLLLDKETNLQYHRT